MVLVTDRTERVAPGTVLQSARGPMTVIASRPHQNGWLVQFEGVLSRNDAEELRGAVLLAEPLDDPDADWVHDLIGASVVDTNGSALGQVDSVEDNPAADFLVLDTGGLIPMSFVVDVTRDGPVVVTVDIPEGLLD